MRQRRRVITASLVVVLSFLRQGQSRQVLPQLSCAHHQRSCSVKRRPSCPQAGNFPGIRTHLPCDGLDLSNFGTPVYGGPGSSYWTRVLRIAGASTRPSDSRLPHVKKADVILIGHGHFDHMSDAVSVGIRTGAIVVGAPLTTEKLMTQGIDSKQVRTVTGKGGEVLQFHGFKLEPILARHGEPPRDVTRRL